MRISDWSSDVCSSDLRIGKIALGQIVDLDGCDHRPLVRWPLGQRLNLRVQEHTPAFEPRRNRHIIEMAVYVHVLDPRLKIRAEEHTSELQSLMRSSTDVFCLKSHNTKLTMALV